MAGNVDPNEVFAFLRTTTNRPLLEAAREACAEKLEESNVLGESVGLQEARTQPTDEYHPGLQAQPLAGPSPQRVGGATVTEQEAINRATLEGQQEDGRGPGPQPVTVKVGPEEEGAAEEAQGVLQKHFEKLGKASAGDGTAKGKKGGKGGEPAVAGASTSGAIRNDNAAQGTGEQGAPAAKANGKKATGGKRSHKRK